MIAKAPTSSHRIGIGAVVAGTSRIVAEVTPLVR